jgi:HK97 family phage portal protein
VAFVVSDGSLRPLQYDAPTPAFSATLAPSLTQSYGAIYRSQPAVRTVVSFLGRNIAQLGIHVFRRVSELDRQRDTAHPLARLLARPNPYTTRYRLIDALVQDKAVFDAAYWLKVRHAAGIGVVRLPPWKVELVGDGWLAPQKFRLHGRQGWRDFDPDEIVHFRGYSAEDLRSGVSPIETLNRTLAEEWAAGQYREQVLRNGARMSGYIKRPPMSPWKDLAKQRFRAEWQAQYTGDGPSAGGTPILEDGMEFVPAAQTAEQLQYVEARKLTREEVASAYHIPPPMVGLLDRATFSNIDTQHRMLYQDTLGPVLTEITEDIELQLLPDLDDGGQVYVEFNLAEKLRGSFQEEAAALSTSVGRPWMTANEARARKNLPQLDGGDELVTPLNVLVGGLASPRDTAPEPGEASAPVRRTKAGRTLVKARAGSSIEAEHAEVFRQVFRRQQAALRSKAGAARGKALIDDVWDADRWDRELAADLLALALKAVADVAQRVLAALGLDPAAFDQPRTVNFLSAVAERVASSVNAVTRAQVAEVLGDPEALDEVFVRAVDQRAPEAARTQVTNLSGFASAEAVKQTGRRATKTWLVTSNNPRPTHLAMNGQTVELDERFSNGAAWPADPALGVDEVAGCECELEVSVEDDDAD